jgi:hypothetical protein
MTTKLDGVLKRELSIGGEPYTLTLSQEGFMLALKGHRKGLDIRWADLVGGDAALATALNASLTANIVPRGKATGAMPRAEAAIPERRAKAAKPKQRAEVPKPDPRAKPSSPKLRANAVKAKRRRSRN